MKCVLIILFTVVVWTPCLCALVLPLDNRAEALELLSRNAHSPCWQSAIESLVRSCKQIDADDTIKSRFAVQLTNCHLAKSGRETYTCTPSMSIEECTGSMDSVAFTSYTEFYVSSENICYYLQAEFFQNLTEEKINQLYNSVTDSITFMENLHSHTKAMHNSMEESLGIQKLLSTSMNSLHDNLDTTRSSIDNLNMMSDNIKAKVENTLQNQNKLTDAQVLLMEEQQRSTAEAQRMMSDIFFSAKDISAKSVKSLEHQKQLLEFQGKAVDGIIGLGVMADQTISKQRQLLEGQKLLEQEHERAREFYNIILNTLEKLTFVQQLLMSEFLDMHALVFYSLCAMLSFLLTTTSQTRAARFWMFLSLPIFVGLEVLLRSRGWSSLDTFYSHHERVWLLRTRLIPAYGLLLLCRSIWVYTDQTKLIIATHSMMLEMLDNQKQLKAMMKDILENQELFLTGGVKGGCARTREHSSFLSRLSPFRKDLDETSVIVISE